jgi:hypothetical protein
MAAKTLEVTSYDRACMPHSGHQVTYAEFRQECGKFLSAKDLQSLRHLKVGHTICLGPEDSPAYKVTRLREESDRFSRAYVTEKVQREIDAVQKEHGPFNAANGWAQLPKDASREKVIAYGRFVALDELADTLELDVLVNYRP